ncbi:MAG TPA: Asp-tRNA(Asn)/Glu-tRNA(Gln) amidotransferase subunit GatC [Polyangia bacterium]
MPRIDPNEVREIAQLSRLRLSEPEVARLTGELDAILGYIDELKQVDTEGVEPMTHAVPFDCPLRADEVGPMLTPDEALAGAPRREGTLFVVPRIVPGPGGDM